MRALLALTVSLGILLAPRLALACEVSPEVRAALDERDFAAAERLARADVERDPDRLEARLELAHVYVEWSIELTDVRRLAQAIDLLEETVRRWPDALRPHVCLLELRQLREETEPFFAELDATLRRFPEPNPQLAGSLEPLLRHFLEDDQNASAEKMCRAVSGRRDATVPFLSNCGMSALRQQDLGIALARLRRAREGDPNDALVAHNLAMTEILSGELAAAAATLGALEVLESYPQDAVALAVVATAREPGTSLPAWQRAVSRLGDPDAPPEAKAWLQFARQAETALAGGELDGSSLAAMARALMESQPTLAAALAHGAASRAPADASFPYLLAQAMEENRLDWQAFVALERAAALPPLDSSVLDIPPGVIDLEAGRVATKVGHYADAVAHLERARAVREDLPNLQYLLGHAYEGIGDPAAAERAYRECLRRPNNQSDYTPWCEKNAARLASVPAAPEPEPTSDFERLLATARASEASAAGKAYVSSSTPALGPRLGAAVAACVPWLREGVDSAARILLVRIAADGSVAEARLAEAGRESACFAASLRGALAPAPPAADWWLVYDLTVR